MKLYKVFLLLIGLSITSCSDLVEEPISLLSPEGVFNTTDDIQSAVYGAYTHAINEEIWGRKLSVALMLRSDMVNLQSSQTRRVEMDQHTITDDNEMVYDPWRRIHLGIAAANTAIEGGKNVDAAEGVKNPVIAQAYFIRAFYYFHLVRLFGDVPYIGEVITSDNLEEIKSISVTPEAEVYENIIADLEYAETWLPNSATKGLPSKAAAKSYLALVYLTRAGTNGTSDFQNAYDYAKEVIDNKGTYGVGLDDNFQDLFNAEEVDGLMGPIFVLDYNGVEADDNAYDQIAPMTGIRGDQSDYNDSSDDGDGGWSVAVPTLAVYNSFDVDDYRTRVSFQTEAMIGGTIVSFDSFTVSGHEHAANQPYIAKYTRYPGDYGRGAKRATSHNYSMMRYAEVLLIAAEAAIEIGNTSEALTLVNEVRARARKGGNSTNGGYLSETVEPSTVPEDLSTITVADVLEERRIELAFEGKRWYDIKRRQLGDVVFSASGYEGAKSGWNSAEDYDTPFPQDEVLANPNLTN